MKTKVIEIIDGDTFRVSPEWKWDDKTGDTVRPKGYNTPEKGEEGYEEAKEELINLIDGETVELKNATNISYGRLVCDVYYNGNNIADYFPDYQ